MIHNNVNDWIAFKLSTASCASRKNYKIIKNDDYDDNQVETVDEENNNDVSELVHVETETRSSQTNNNNHDTSKKEGVRNNTEKAAKKKLYQNNDIDISECLKDTAKTQLIPIFFNLIATVLTYTLIGVTNCFEPLRVYCLLLGIPFNSH